MLKKLVESVKTMADRAAFDPATLNDPVAMQTSWSPAKRGGTNFKTHSLKQVHAQRMEFRCSPGMFLFGGIFLAIGIGLLAMAIHIIIKGTEAETAEYIMPPLMGLVFGGAGFFMLRSAMTPRVFDLGHGYYCCSRKKPEQMMDPSRIKDYVLLHNVHALQLISEYVRGSGKNRRSYHSYEINLVLNDGSRINVVDHGNPAAIRRDARQLADFLGKPLWDTSGFL